MNERKPAVDALTSEKDPSAKLFALFIDAIGAAQYFDGKKGSFWFTDAGAELHDRLVVEKAVTKMRLLFRIGVLPSENHAEIANRLKGMEQLDALYEAIYRACAAAPFPKDQSEGDAK